MHKVILFRGGYCGDVILSMINKEYVRSFYPLKNVRKRFLMKKFYNYTTKQKIEYFNEFNQTGKTEYTISHDTNFCSRPEIKKNVIQLHCSDEKLVPHFSSRFFIKNDWEDVSHIIGDLNSTFESKDKDYAEDVTNWQLFYKFPNSFDIKNIYKANFLDELQSTFEINDINWAKTIYTNWLTKE